MYLGNLPIVGAASILNSHSQRCFYYLYWLILEQDPRKRTLVPAIAVFEHVAFTPFPGRHDAHCSFDLGHFRLAGSVCNSSIAFFIPHSTLRGFLRTQKTLFHQPSRIRDSSRIRQLLSVGALKEFSGIGEIETHLASDVVEQLLPHCEAQIRTRTRDKDRHKIFAGSRAGPL